MDQPYNPHQLSHNQQTVISLLKLLRLEFPILQLCQICLVFLISLKISTQKSQTSRETYILRKEEVWLHVTLCIVVSYVIIGIIML